MEYAWEKFMVASGCLGGEGPLRERLINAWVSALHRLQGRDVPQEIQDRWVALQAQIQRVRSQRMEGSIHASIRTMNDAEARAMSDEILALYDWICHARGQRDAQRRR